jgi:hypothetical protein
MGLKFRRGSTAQQSGSLAFGEPYVNTTLGTLVVGGATGDIVLSAGGTGSTGNFGAISGSGLDITGNANIAGNVTVGGTLQIGDNTSDTLNVVSSLSSSLIPQTTNAFDLGSADKIWRDLYISTGSIKFVEGTTVVKTLNANTLTALEVATGSSNVSLTNLNTTTASLNISITNLNTTTASLIQRVEANESVSGTFARTNSDNTFSGLQTFNNVNVNGTASFAYIQSTTGSSTSIGESFIVLNESTPSSNFAGIKVVDSGSSFTTASFVYDGLNNNWVFEKANVGSSDTSVAIFGPISTGGLGTEVGLTQNKLPKAVSSHGHHIGDSNITDDGSLITLGSNTTITGTLVASGTTLVSGSSQINATATTNFTTGVKTQLDANTVVSGSSQINVSSTTGDIALGSRTSGNYVASLVAGTGVTLSNNSGEGTTPTVAIGQSVATNATPTFGNLTINGTITATGDITAFFTSDRRHKNNIQLIPNALDKVSKLNGVTWEWNEDVNEVTKSTPKTGLIAQEVQEVLPQVVVERENGFLGLDYSKMMGLMVEAIKEQQTQIHSLTIEIENLKKNNSL